MHHLILGAAPYRQARRAALGRGTRKGWALAATWVGLVPWAWATTPAPAPRCDAPLREAAESFYPADCLECWARAGTGSTPRWRLDWVLPADATDAPMASAALAEAHDRHRRWQRQSVSKPATPETDGAKREPQSLTRLDPRRGRLSVAAGPAWQGYFGVQWQWTARQPLPPGSTGWLALIEAVPAGSAGNGDARALVRSVAGPLALGDTPPGRTMSHLQAMRWPEGARADRLQAQAWIEGPDGRLLAVADEACTRR